MRPRDEAEATTSASSEASEEKAVVVEEPVVEEAPPPVVKAVAKEEPKEAVETAKEETAVEAKGEDTSKLQKSLLPVQLLLTRLIFRPMKLLWKVFRKICLPWLFWFNLGCFAFCQRLYLPFLFLLNNGLV